MPREGAIIFRDIVGKLDVLNVECDKCGRRGSIPRRSADRAVWHRREVVRVVRRDNGGLPAEAGKEPYICGARCPDLPKVV
jgi:hypothetical protein